MPFTVSHAIVAVPFARSGLPAGAVAAGALVPDVPLYLPIGPPYSITHAFPWAFVAGVSLAFVALALWRVAVRPISRSVTPRAFAERLPAEWSGGPAAGWRSLWLGKDDRPSIRSAALLIAALMIGVATHLIWDGFTHTGRWGSLLVPALDEQYLGHTGAAWLQGISSVLGLAGLAVWATVWFRRRRATAEGRPAGRGRLVPMAFWTVIILALIAGTITTALAAYGPSGISAFVFAWITTVGGWLAIAAVLAGVLAQVVRQTSPNPGN